MFNATNHVPNVPTAAPTHPHSVVYVGSSEEDLGSISVFISAVLLSLGGCFSIVFAHLRKSNCRIIDCCCFKLQRENLGIEGDVVV